MIPDLNNNWILILSQAEFEASWYLRVELYRHGPIWLQNDVEVACIDEFAQLIERLFNTIASLLQ